MLEHAPGGPEKDGAEEREEESERETDEQVELNRFISEEKCGEQEKGDSAAENKKCGNSLEDAKCEGRGCAAALGRRFVPMEDCVVEKFSVGGDGTEGGGCGVGENVFDDDEGVGPEKCVEDVLRDGSIGAEGEPGEEEEGGVDDKATGAEEDPLFANECGRRGVAEASHGDAVEDPSNVERVKMEERFAGADHYANGMITKEARKEGVASFVGDGEWILQEEDEDDDGNGGELECAAVVAGEDSDERGEKDQDGEQDIESLVETTVAIRAI
jgi:hypothetical protein